MILRSEGIKRKGADLKQGLKYVLYVFKFFFLKIPRAFGLEGGVPSQFLEENIFSISAGHSVVVT